MLKLNKEQKEYLHSLLKKMMYVYGSYLSEKEYLEHKDHIDFFVKHSFLSLECLNISSNISRNNYQIDMKDGIKKKIYKIKFNDTVFKEIAKSGLENKNIKSQHDQIIFNFVNYLNLNEQQMYFSNFEIKTQFGISRPDLYVLNDCRDISSANAVCYEIKHSHNDFMSDIKKPAKRASYLEISSCLYYVCPNEVIKPHEVPKEAGLIYMLNDGSFKEIIKAPINNQWKNNFNKSLLITLIKNKNIANYSLFINEDLNHYSKLSKKPFEKSFTKDLNILLSKKHISILDKFQSDTISLNMRELYLFDEDYKLILDLISLNLLKVKKIEPLPSDWENDFNYYFNLFMVLKYQLTELGTKFIKEYMQFKKSFYQSFCEKHIKIYDREIKSKYWYSDIKINGICFDYYSANLDNKLNKVILTGFIKAKNETDLKNKHNGINYFQYAQKVNFVCRESTLTKKMIPKEFGLSYYSRYNSSIDNEVKRSKKVLIDDVSDEILFVLLKKEYHNSVNLEFS